MSPHYSISSISWREDAIKHVRCIHWGKTVAAWSAFVAFCFVLFFFFLFVKTQESMGCYYVGCLCLKTGRFLFFPFVVVTNLHINLFIKLSPLLVGMYCSDCLQQKQANQNPFLSCISRGRGPTHPYLCDVKASFDLFIKLGLNLWLPYKGVQATRTATVTRTPQNNGLNEQKQSLCTCVLHFGTFLYRSLKNNNMKWPNFRFSREWERMTQNLLYFFLTLMSFILI